MSTAAAGNSLAISMVNDHPPPSFQSFVRVVESNERNNLVEKRQAHELLYDDETINTIIQERDVNERKRAESLYAYMEKMQRQTVDAQSSPIISQLECHFVSSEYTALLCAAAANPPVPKEPSEYRQIEFITVNPQDFYDGFDDDSDDDSMEGDDDVDHAVSADTVSGSEAGKSGHMNAGYETDLNLSWRNGGLSGSEIEMEATTDPTSWPDLSHRNPELSQDVVDAMCSKLWNYLFMSAVKMWNRPSCRNGCDTVNYRSHFKALCNSLKSAPRESRLRTYLAQSMLGCDPHQTIAQVKDTLPYLRRDVKRIEIPFVPANTALGSAGISFLDILFKCAGIMHSHCVPLPQLNSNLETVILRIPTHDGIYCHKLKYRCISGALTYCDLALFVVRIVVELFRRKKFILVYGMDRRVYPIPSLTHGRLVSLCSVDGVFWWPLFSVTSVDPGTGVPIPSLPY